MRLVLPLIIFMSVFGMVSQAGEGVDPNKSVLVKVIHYETEVPVTDVTLDTQIEKKKIKLAVDSQGFCVVDLGKKEPNWFRVTALKDRHVVRGHYWSKARAKDGLPEEIVIKMEPGTTIGGMVHNESGDPIQGAKIHLHVSSRPGQDRVSFHGQDIRTDQQGRWECHVIPADVQEVLVRLEHSEYISQRYFRSEGVPSITQLRDKSGVMVMKQGIVVQGTVKSEDGDPIKDATVTIGHEQMGEQLKVKTNEEGQYIFKNAEPGEAVLMVKEVKDYAPALKKFFVREALDPIHIQLNSGKSIRGCIVDQKGQPIKGAMAAVETWHGCRMQIWRKNTDKDGRFHWKHAPADGLMFTFQKKGYMGIRDYELNVSEEEAKITLPPVLKITGTVVDAESGELIDSFNLLKGIEWQTGQPVHWDTRDHKTFHQGTYELSITYPYPGHALRVEADGYLPCVSRTFMNNEGRIEYNFKLSKGKGIEGTVLLSDGKPAKDAQVVLATPAGYVHIENGEIPPYGQNQPLITKEDGRFTFPAQTDPFNVIVLHEEGFAKVDEEDLTESKEITLDPWTTVKGIFKQGKEPGVNKEMTIFFNDPYEQGAPRIHMGYGTKTNTKGEFVFERVVPRSAFVCRSVRMDLGQGRMMTTFSHDVPIDPKPGETITVTIGGNGRQIVGKVEIPKMIIDKTSWEHIDSRVSIDSDDNPYKRIAASFKKDGSFQIDDLPTGQYTLTVTAYERPADPRRFRGKQIADMSKTFEVLEVTPDNQASPLDLGTITMDVIGGLDLVGPLKGKSLPSFEGIHLDLNADQLRGKEILVCFFDRQQRASRYQVVKLSKKLKELNRDDLVCILIQATPMDTEKLSTWAKDQNLDCVVGVITGDAKKIRMNWAAKALPWLVLTNKEHVVGKEGFRVKDL